MNKPCETTTEICLKKRHAFPMLLIGFLALSAPSSDLFADDYNCGIQAYQQGKHDKAFQCIKMSAEQGHIKAQYLVCTMYRLGLGVEQNEYKAFEWCKQAAEEGILEAQFQLGLMYLEGDGVTPDDEEAIKWLWEAADRGYPQASEILQFIFSDDFSVGC